MAKFKVLFIGGWGRSGSTLLGNLLGQYEGFCSVGEIRNIWDYGLLENRLCGCGQRFRACSFWTRTLSEAFGDMHAIDAIQLAAYRDQFSRSRHFWGLLLRGNRSSALADYLKNLELLYTGVVAQTGCQVIVDSSKQPSHALALALIPSCELHIIHLIRDPRAVAFSWRRRKLQLDATGKQYMPQYSVAKSTLMWNAWNISLELLQQRLKDHYIRQRYEDFVKSPIDTIRLILGQLGATVTPETPFNADHTIILKPTHTLAGNPNRFETGTVSIKEDSEWTGQLSKRDKAVINAMSWPLLIRYHYA